MMPHRWIHSIQPAAPLLLACFILNSCGNLDRDYRLRYWEKCRIASEQALRKKQLRMARSMAEEAVYQAQGFGESDFRLGVSLCDLGDVLKAAGKDNESEDAYKRAVTVLQAARDKTLASEMSSDRAKKAEERETYKVMRRLDTEDLANTLSHLADLYALQERNKDAARCFGRASNIYQSVLEQNQWGVDDCPMGQELVQCLVGLAQVSIAARDNETAERAYKRALDIAVASHSPEFMLVEIRDSYLKLLQQLGRTPQAAQLIADALYSKCTSEGIQAMLKEDYPAAEALFRQAYMAAQQSIFSQRRLMRSLFNLQSVFAKEHKFWEMEQTIDRANDLMLSRRLRFDSDFDQMLANEARYYLQTHRASQAAVALDKQLRYRLEHYGPGSLQVCETYALKGQAELQSNNPQAALQSGMYAYKNILSKHMSNRRAGNAIMEAASLMESLNRFEEAEVLNKHLVDLNVKAVQSNDLRVIGNEASLFVFYYRFHKHDKALKVANDAVGIINKVGPGQRAQAMPYIVLMQAYALYCDWYDVAEPLTKIGQSILRNAQTGVPMDAVSQTNWNNSIAKMEKHFGRKF